MSVVAYFTHRCLCAGGGSKNWCCISSEGWSIH